MYFPTEEIRDCICAQFNGNLFEGDRLKRRPGYLVVQFNRSMPIAHPREKEKAFNKNHPKKSKI